MNDSIFSEILCQPGPLSAVLRAATGILRQAGIDSARLDAEILVADALSVSRLELYLQHDRWIQAEELRRIAIRLERRSKFEPVAYIVGCKEFYGLDFHVRPGVLIPRPETETIIDAVREWFTPESIFRFADTCTGSGILGVVLATYFPRSQGVLIDISDEALAIARSNVQLHGLKQRLLAVQGDLLHPTARNQLDLVVANPPYLAPREVEETMPDVRLHEPRLALEGGDTGCLFLQRLVEQAQRALKPGGMVCVEMGWQQEQWVQEQFHGPAWERTAVLKDLAGHDRVVVAHRSKCQRTT